MVIAAQIVAANLHFLARQMVKGEVEFQDRRAGIFAVGVAFDHGAQGLQRLEGQPLIATHFIDLVIIAQRQEILRIGGIIFGGIEINEPLRGGAAVGVVLIFVIGESLHDQRAFGPFRIGIKALDLGEIKRRLTGVVVGQLIFAALKNLLG